MFCWTWRGSLTMWWCKLYWSKGAYRSWDWKKIVSIGANGGFVFIGCKTNVSMQMKKKLAPYLVVMHYCAHCTNLAIQTFFSLSITDCLEDLLQSFHFLFCKKSQRKCLNCKSLQLSWTPKVTKSCKLLKFARFSCCLHANGLWLNTKPSLQRCQRIKLKMKLQDPIWKSSWIWNSFFDSIKFYHFLSWFTPWSSMLKGGMYRFVILLR